MFSYPFSAPLLHVRGMSLIALRLIVLVSVALSKSLYRAFVMYASLHDAYLSFHALSSRISCLLVFDNLVQKSP